MSPDKPSLATPPALAGWRAARHPSGPRGRHLIAALLAAAFASGAGAQATATAGAGAASPSVPTPLPALNVPPYMGTWYQMALFPNYFQKQCVSDTTATYRQLPGGQVEVVNRCKTKEGRFESVSGMARPSGSRLEGEQLKPAQLEVSFMPAWLRWLPFWGSYWVLALAEDGRYAVVGEGSREYLWVLTREPRLTSADETAIRSLLQQQGYDLTRWQAHPHSAPGSSPTPPAPR